MPKGIPLTDEEIYRRRHEIFRASFHVMVEKGFSDTSMREIAEAAGLGKSTLYDYFRSKDEVLLFIVEEQTEQVTEMAKEVISQPIPAVEKIRKIMKVELSIVLEKKAFYLQLFSEAQKLGVISQKRIAGLRYAYQDLIKSVIEQGIHEGSFRKVNTLLATRMLLNTLSNVVYTSRPTGTPEEMLDEILDLFLLGAMQRNSPSGAAGN